MQITDCFGTLPRESKKLRAFAGIVSYRVVSMHRQKQENMKKLVGIVLLTMIVAGCAQQDYRVHYSKREAKKKMKHYNDVFFSRQKQEFKNK
jgi:uncharacterized lipoprotein YajG